MESKTANHSELKNIISQFNGKFFGLCYTKKNGENVCRSGRVGTYNLLKTAGQKLKRYTEIHNRNGLFVYYDTKHRGYRSCKIDRINQIKFKNQIFTFNSI